MSFVLPSSISSLVILYQITAEIQVLPALAGDSINHIYQQNLSLLSWDFLAECMSQMGEL
jgi:hypothetical protein